VGVTTQGVKKKADITEGATTQVATTQDVTTDVPQQRMPQ